MFWKVTSRIKCVIYKPVEEAGTQHLNTSLMGAVLKEGQGAAGECTKALRYENKLLSGNHKYLGRWAGPVPGQMGSSPVRGRSLC